MHKAPEHLFPDHYRNLAVILRSYFEPALTLLFFMSASLTTKHTIVAEAKSCSFPSPP